MGSAASSSFSASSVVWYRNAINVRLQRDALELPVLPEVAQRVMAMTTGTDIDARKLSRLVHRDQALAAQVLRVANSARYSPGRPIVSLTQAVTRLGARTLGDIAFGVAVKGKVFNAPGYERQMRYQWQHAIVAATYGKEIARMKRLNVEGQFLSGLLHEIGKPVTLQILAKLQDKLPLPPPSPEDVHDLIDQFNVKVGLALISAWKLPERVETTTAYHKTYVQAPTFQDETKITYLSNVLATWLLSEQPSLKTELKADPVFAALNMYPEDADAVLEKAPAVMSVVDAMCV
ncbi:MAG: HDOD domain-containing protein [Bacteroidota bacterium]